MSNTVESHSSSGVPTNKLIRRTVAVVDMVAFSSVARMLEENSSANAVYELSRQIQDFFERALAQLPDSNAYCVVSKPGDGIILLFEQPNDAHSFGCHVHQFAEEHNSQRNIANAKRWFRVGVATGDVVTTESADSPSEYAGIVIANAVRLESAADPGEILVDVATFAAMSTANQSLYGAEELVSGKRDERFRARRCRVSKCDEPSPEPQHQRFVTRRAFITAGSVLLGSAAIGTAWLRRSSIDDWMHPLPAKRFVAVMGWPGPTDKRLEAMIQAVVNAISTELARSEAYDRDLYIIPQRANGSVTSMAELDELRAAVGANLVLAISASDAISRIDLSLRILDTAASKVLRHRTLSFAPDEQISVPVRAVRDAANLLNAPNITTVHAATGIGTSNPEAYAALQKAEAERARENDLGIMNAIAGFKQAIELDSRYALAHAKLAMTYMRLYVLHRDIAALSLARANCQTCLALDPLLVDGYIALGYVLDYSGDRQGSLDAISKALSIDPQHHVVLLQRGQLLTRLNRWPEAEETFATLQRVRINYWLGHQELAVLYGAEGKFQSAIDELRIATLASPMQSRPTACLSLVMLQMGNLDRSVEFAQKSLAIQENDLAARAMSAALRCRGEFDKSVAYALRAVSLDPDDPDNYMELGDSYGASGIHESESRKAFQKASVLQADILKTDPVDGPTWMAFSLAQSKARKFDASAESLHQADLTNAKDIDSQVRKVRTLVLLNRHEDAVTTALDCIRRGATPVLFQWTPDLEDLRRDSRFISAG